MKAVTFAVSVVCVAGHRQLGNRKLNHSSDNFGITSRVPSSPTPFHSPSPSATLAFGNWRRPTVVPTNVSRPSISQPSTDSKMPSCGKSRKGDEDKSHSEIRGSSFPPASSLPTGPSMPLLSSVASISLSPSLGKGKANSVKGKSGKGKSKKSHNRLLKETSKTDPGKEGMGKGAPKHCGDDVGSSTNDYVEEAGIAIRSSGEGITYSDDMIGVPLSIDGMAFTTSSGAVKSSTKKLRAEDERFESITTSGSVRPVFAMGGAVFAIGAFIHSVSF